MQEKVLMASCPICGRTLFRGKPNSYIEGSCPKCKQYLQISYQMEGVQLRVSDNKYDGKTETTHNMPMR